MRNIFTITILVVNLRGAPYGLTYDIYENYYDYEISDNSLGADNNNLVQTPQFITQPLDVIVNSGETARLPCLVDRPEGFVLLWHKNEQIISVGQTMFDKASTKYEVEETSGGNYLHVLTTDIEDAGHYRCSVSAYNKREIIHQLRIRVKPEIQTSPNDVVTVEEGSSLSLLCSVVEGFPEPVLRWGRCGGQVVGESSVLSLSHLDRSQAGCYQCMADNGWSQEPVTRDLILIVQYPPTIQLERTEDSVEKMTITCAVVSSPAAKVLIYREKESGVRETLYSSEGEGGGVTVRHNNEETVYSLYLQNLTQEEFGDYTCSADSPLGQAIQTTRVAGWPRVSSVKISSDPPQSSCYRVSVQLDSQHSVHNVHLMYRDSKGDTLGQANLPPSFNNFISHRQCNLTFSTNYSLDITATNSYGPSGAFQYNFTTESQNIFNLPWSAANSVEPTSMIMLVLQLLLMIRTFSYL